MNPPLPPLDVAAHLPFLARALEEDHAADDITTRALVDGEAVARADVIVRAPGVLAGLPLAQPVLCLLDPAAEVVLHQADGESVAQGSIALTVRARARAILSAERTVLNL
ncbi:MAG: nicotinate-nucleotide diphosphorylase (carboxylating), partial [Planctomycetota bacterium]